jgi:glycosidase
VKGKIRIYQLLPRIFTNTCRYPVPNGTLDQNCCGKFNHLNHKLLTELKNFGITHIWLTGILRHSTTTDYSAFGLEPSNPDIVKGKAGSPYAIKDYYDVDPDLAESVPDRMAEFTSLIDRIHENQMAVLIDFVPNHVSRDYHSDLKPLTEKNLGEDDHPDLAFSRENNFYYLPGQTLTIGSYREFPAKATGNDVFHANPGLHDWYETIKLNYGWNYLTGNWETDPVPDTWKKMTSILLFWASKGIDGFRCDMAGMVPVSFWSYSIGIVKRQYPDILFIAELYEPHAYRDYIELGGFDFLYDKTGLYDTLRGVLTGIFPVTRISDVWKNLEGLDDHMLRFLENHDEQRIASRFFCGNPHPGLPAMALTALMNRGPVMLYAGQEVGEPAQGEEGFSGDDGRTSIFDYTVMPFIREWYDSGSLMGLKMNIEGTFLRSEYSKILWLSAEKVISQGAFYDLAWCNSDQPGIEKYYPFLRYLHGVSNPAPSASDEPGTLVWLIVTCFDRNVKECRVRIPAHALEQMGLSPEQRLTFNGLVPSGLELSNLLPSQITTSGIPVQIGNSGYGIVKAWWPS